MHVAFNDDFSRGKPKEGFQHRDNLGTLQVAVGIENKAVAWFFKHNPATRPFVIFAGENRLRETSGHERPAPEGLPLLPEVVMSSGMGYTIAVLLSVIYRGVVNDEVVAHSPKDANRR